jgi:hypothetical protein
MRARKAASPFTGEFSPFAEFPLTYVRLHDAQRGMCAHKAARPFTDEFTPFAEFPLT